MWKFFLDLAECPAEFPAELYFGDRILDCVCIPPKSHFQSLSGWSRIKATQ